MFRSLAWCTHDHMVKEQWHSFMTNKVELYACFNMGPGKMSRLTPRALSAAHTSWALNTPLTPKWFSQSSTATFQIPLFNSISSYTLVLVAMAQSSLSEDAKDIVEKITNIIESNVATREEKAGMGWEYKGKELSAEIMKLKDIVTEEFGRVHRSQSDPIYIHTNYLSF